ncbi:SpoIIE family protein phosphatase [Treponema sp. OMZ 840]|uniref:PP2C family protein-serine/threonine phosphatase n=1 Tax=Treponema sp. OMZ 840 TaxID=244313 RepID=UPI003D8B45FA
MIFLILNILCAGAVFGLSFRIDFGTTDNKTKNFINMLLMQTLSGLISALCIVFIFFNQHGLASSFARLFLWLSAVQSAALCMWCWRFPLFKNFTLWRILMVAAIALSFYLVFFLLDSVYFDSELQLHVLSKFIGETSIQWFSVYKLAVIYIIPSITVLVLFFKYELCTGRLLRQQMLFFAAVLCTGQILFFLIRVASNVSGQYLFIMLLPLVYAVMFFLFYRIQQNLVLFNISGFVRSAGLFGLTYIFPSLCTGLIFAFLVPRAQEHTITFFLLIIVCAAFLFFVSFFLRNRIFRSARYNDTLYAEQMEKEFSALDFGDIDLEIDMRFAHILQRNLNTVNVMILTETDDHKLTTRYSLNANRVEFDMDDPVFSSLLNIRRRVIFKTHCDTVHELSPIASKLNALFEQTDSAVMILLNEGAHLFGIVLLGERKMEQPYTDYDYKTLNALYSRFFLTGYYLKNIANEELIGLVGREIRFSSQVIQSLQKKTDKLLHPACDGDSFSLSARSLGSGFTDFIKLDTHRYITVIGDLSGKGLNASMLMAILKSMIPIFLAETKDFKSLIQKVNLFIRENLPRGTYFAGMFCLIDMQSKIVYYANCALPAMFMYSKTYNNMIEIQGEGKVLGFVEDVSSLIKVKKIQLSSGDMLVGVTSGLIEIKSLHGEHFGKSRIQHIVLDNIKQPSEKICALLRSAVKEFADKNFENDVSAIVIKML